jgi:hypothetical protein
MNPAIESCLRASTVVPRIDSVADWWPRWRALASRRPTPIELAIAGGYDADRVAWAFASGYQAALRSLVPSLSADALVAFCVTEESGNRPRDIRTTIAIQPDGSVRVDGAKRWTTLGPDSTLLLVVGSLQASAASERPSLKVARLPADTMGLSVQPMPATSFVPEVPHAQVQMHDVRASADALLPGDGYDAYVKPFRSIEDVHVTAAVLAHVLREARARSWPTAFAERLTAALVVLADIAPGEMDSPSLHIALGGALDWAQQLYAEATRLWSGVSDDDDARRWQRDTALFSVASAARSQRAARAWERLG